ncbi:MAG: hypothetical protein ACOWWH_12730 [Eubacteriaceae bacterium]
MYIIIPLIAAYFVYYYTYRDKIKEIDKRIVKIKEFMDKEDIIIGMVKDLKSDFVEMRKEVNYLSKEVSSLKTKAGIISFLSAGIATGLITFVFKMF